LATYEIIEEYLEDKYFPSFLVRLEYVGEVYHALFAVDLNGKSVRVVTAYRPDRVNWDKEFRRRT